MDYLSALRLVHDTIRPENYCEIGCRFGVSLALSRCPSIGIDPEFEIRTELSAPTRLFRMASDEFFDTRDCAGILNGPVDFAFIDGMHLVEFALRDFINLERASHRNGVIAIDDVLPGDIAHATRERNTRIWTGDIYRLIPLLRSFRPDLDIQVYDVDMKGFALVTGLDPSSRLLSERYAEIESELKSGRWELASAGEVREQLAPRPAASLPADLALIAKARSAVAGTGMREAGSRHLDGHRSGEYLDLLKRCILNEIYLDDELRIVYLRSCLLGDDVFDPKVLHDIRGQRRQDYEDLSKTRQIGKFFRKIKNSGFNHSMIGRMRMDSLHACLDLVRGEGIQGHLVECGVWRGGSCIFMAGYLRAHGMAGKNVYVVDSFDGLPKPSLPQDATLDLSNEKYPELAVSLETVKENFSVYGLLENNIVFLKGWFKDSLPTAPLEQIALLRMDGDLYESTMDILVNLYDKVVPDGVVIVDDFNAIPACRQAVLDFLAGRNIPVPEMHVIDWTGVWFRKPAYTSDHASP
jgi:hypothetical protein